MWALLLTGMGFLRTNIKVVFIALGTLVIMFIMWRFEHALEEARDWQATAEKIQGQLAQNEAALKNIEAHNKAIEAAFNREMLEAEKRSKFLAGIIKDISHAPKEDDGIIAPVLKRTLDSLRNAHSTTSDHSGKTTTP